MLQSDIWGILPTLKKLISLNLIFYYCLYFRISWPNKYFWCKSCRKHFEHIASLELELSIIMYSSLQWNALIKIKYTFLFYWKTFTFIHFYLHENNLNVKKAFIENNWSACLIYPSVLNSGLPHAPRVFFYPPNGERVHGGEVIV